VIVAFFFIFGKEYHIIERKGGGELAKSTGQKLKLLYILKILSEKTDENNVISMEELLRELDGHNISAERKSIYDDMEALRTFGADVNYRSEAPKGYQLLSREFELAELKLLVDSVQASKFITSKKSKELIKKLEGLTSKHEARKLDRQVYFSNRIKAANENIYYNVDKIHIAIGQNSKIRYKYFEWNLNKEMNLRKDGESYEISPWALCWDDENYYMLGFDSCAKMIKHYRVDKMLEIEIINESREGKELFAGFNLADFAKKTFGMFGGKEELINISFKNNLIGVVIDNFGKDITIKKDNDESFNIHVKVAVSDQFFGWITGLGDGAKIISPTEVVEKYKEHILKVIAEYKE